jgi:hypothetical protein
MESPYHTSDDTADKIEYAGMVAVTDYMTSFTEEFAEMEIIESSGRASYEHKGQRRFEAGLTASIGSNRHAYKSGALDGKYAFSWHAGLYGQLNMGFYAIRLKALYENRAAQWPDATDSKVSHKFSVESLSLPVDIMFKTSSTESIYAYLFAGGYYSYVFSGNFADTGYQLGRDVARHEGGLQFGLGFKVYNMSLEFSTRYGLTGVLLHDPVVRNQTSYFTLGWRF